MHDGTEYNAYFVAGDTRSDIAVLKIREDVKLKVPVFGNSSSVVSGETVCAIGCPNGYNSKATITVGIVSVPKVRRTITSVYSSNFIQTDSAINPGNSGGALVNTYGQIVGITSAKISDTSYEGVGFAIPTNTVKRITESLIKNGNVKDRARLGIQYRFYSNASAEIKGMAMGGLLISSVQKDSDLYGKLNENDLIIKVNEHKITNDSIILDVLEEHIPGDIINLTVLREDGKTEVISARLLSDEGSSSYTIAKV
jgi:serine protease Do